ncbi:PQQ-dependent sugar dehydrogenase [Alkalicaulis satelles]|uniref:PQQ-dependent sugar dehydrogenase n=1 Tax=Alkalicaulis satelles TaxID=2609175 RepID=A0A5M6ZG14_9PROT|nr:PQQ-dependent sugar dehydrogenase [Alkalicaulis satelles]KAA5803702.1 PQQ-dependent sugar dehydrogenase [Alkalicaulis satelles]
MMMVRLAAAASLVALAGCSDPPRSWQAQDIDPANYQLTVIASGLNHPWGLAFLPDGAMLVTERNGAVRLIDGDGNLQDAAVTGGPDDVFAGGQGGLLDIVLAPDFETSGLVYISYSAGTASANHPALWRGRFDGQGFSGGETVFRAVPDRATEHHYGGRMVFLPDGSLVLTLGDGFAYRERAQHRDDHLGAIVRLTHGGAAPEDNPFHAGGGAAAYVYSYGHRNVQGLAFDPQTGVLWSHEHGPRGGDELNVIEPGVNYGWPVVSQGIDYTGARISPFETLPDFPEPVHVWTPSIAPSGLALHEGDLYVTALAGRALHRLELDDQGRVARETRLLTERGQRLRHVLSGPDGALWLLTDAPDGQVLRLTPAP